MSLDDIHNQITGLERRQIKTPTFVAWFWSGDASLGPSALFKAPLIVKSFFCDLREVLIPRDNRLDKQGDSSSDREELVGDGRNQEFFVDLDAVSEVYFNGVEIRGTWTFMTLTRKIRFRSPPQPGTKILVMGKSPYSRLQITRLFVTDVDGIDLQLPAGHDEIGRMPVCDKCPQQINCLMKRPQPIREEEYRYITGHSAPPEPKPDKEIKRLLAKNRGPTL
jgi:hypothetical protein